MQHDHKVPDPDTVIESALSSLEIDSTHSDACLEETYFWLENDGLDDSKLLDLTTLPFVTMDNPDSRDLDQALLIESDGQGYRLRYALADASYYIKPGSALFDEALARGTTFYTPLLSVPMLPIDLSEGLISLNPDVTRRALVFDMRLAGDSSVISSTVVRAKIRSQAKLDYARVQAWLDSGESDSKIFHSSLRLLRELGEKLIENSARRGVIAFDRTECDIFVEGSPPRFHARPRQRFRTERYNEQISLLCNMQGAEMLLGFRGVSNVLQAVFRVHDAPLKKSYAQLKKTMNAFAQCQPDPENWRWQEGQSLADFVDGLPQSKQYKRQVRAIQRQIMQAQRASVFQPEPGEHHALKASSYARFSSPMREIVGIFTHKELLEALGGMSYNNDHDSALREQIIDAANSARQRQRQLDKSIEFAAMFSVFSHDMTLQEPATYTGTLIGMRSDRLYISLDTIAMDIKVYKEDLQQQYDTRYTLSDVIAEPADILQPTWQLGQGLKVNLHSYEKERKRFRFLINCMEKA